MPLQEDIMNKHKHLTLDDRIIIQHGLEAGESFRSIAGDLGKDPGTISKEVKTHIQFKQTGCYGKPYNNCLLRKNCGFQSLCGKVKCNRTCSFCHSYECSTLCKEYTPETCLKLTKSPYVCNGCETRRKCSLEKRLYSASAAQKEYEAIRSEARQGLQITEKDALRLDALISPLLLKGQSLHHICVSQADEVMLHERTLYHYVNKGVFSARNIDMPRVVRMGRRKPKTTFKVDRKCRENRTYLDYRTFMEANPGIPVVEIDSVEGTKGGKVLLTIHFVVPQYMLAFIREANTSRSVTDVFNVLFEELGLEGFKEIFPVLLGDNGSEFSNPAAIEYTPDGILRSRVFFCDPHAPYQKGAAENNHTLLRRIIPKGTSFDGFNQEHITLLMNHVNSYIRKNLGDKSPYEAFTDIYGDDFVKKMGAELISPDKVIMHPSLLK